MVSTLEQVLALIVFVLVWTARVAIEVIVSDEQGATIARVEVRRDHPHAMLWQSNGGAASRMDTVGD